MRLLSWLDIQREIRRRCPDRNWPDPISSIHCFWDGVEIQILPGANPADATKILQDWFGDWYKDGDREEAASILLDTGKEKSLPISVQESEDPIEKQELFLPFWEDLAHRPDFHEDQRTDWPQKVLPEPWSDDGPAIAVFHSFKGGVGRTTHLLACLQAALVLKCLTKFSLWMPMSRLRG